MEKKVTKVTRVIREYQTGDKIPDNAVYLNSLMIHYPSSIPHVVHYFIIHT